MYIKQQWRIQDLIFFMGGVVDFDNGKGGEGVENH